MGMFLHYTNSSVYLSRFYKEKLRLKRCCLYGFDLLLVFFVQKARAGVCLIGWQTWLAGLHHGESHLLCPLYERIIESYKAELYKGGWVNIRKKNHILRYIPSMFRPRKGCGNIWWKLIAICIYTAPDIYDQKVKASVGTASKFWEMDGFGCRNIFTSTSILLPYYMTNYSLL